MKNISSELVDGVGLGLGLVGWRGWSGPRAKKDSTTWMGNVEYRGLWTPEPIPGDLLNPGDPSSGQQLTVLGQKCSRGLLNIYDPENDSLQQAWLRLGRTFN